MPMQNFEPLYDYKVPEGVFPIPLNLYTRDTDYHDPPFWTYRGLYAGFASGVVACSIGLTLMRRPLHSSFHISMMTGIGLGLACFGFQKVGERYNMFRDQVYKHYIMLHPEDFPIPEKKKFGEKWEMFIPTRAF